MTNNSVKVIEIKSHDSKFLLTLIAFLNETEAEPSSTLVTIKEDISSEEFARLMSDKADEVLMKYFEKRAANKRREQ